MNEEEEKVLINLYEEMGEAKGRYSDCQKNILINLSWFVVKMLIDYGYYNKVPDYEEFIDFRLSVWKDQFLESINKLEAKDQQKNCQRKKTFDAK